MMYIRVFALFQTITVLFYRILKNSTLYYYTTYIHCIYRCINRILEHEHCMWLIDLIGNYFLIYLFFFSCILLFFVYFSFSLISFAVHIILYCCDIAILMNFVLLFPVILFQILFFTFKVIRFRFSFNSNQIEEMRWSYRGQCGGDIKDGAVEESKIFLMKRLFVGVNVRLQQWTRFMPNLVMTMVDLASLSLNVWHNGLTEVEYALINCKTGFFFFFTIKRPFYYSNLRQFG